MIDLQLFIFDVRFLFLRWTSPSYLGQKNLNMRLISSRSSDSFFTLSAAVLVFTLTTAYTVPPMTLPSCDELAKSTDCSTSSNRIASPACCENGAGLVTCVPDGEVGYFAMLVWCKNFGGICVSNNNKGPHCQAHTPPGLSE